MPEVPEYVVNVKLAEILSRDLGIDARAERVKGRRRPDIRCYYRGLIISIETSYSRGDAEEDAKKRVEQGLADIAIALWLKTRYRDIRDVELEKAIRSSTFDVKVFVPREVAGTLIQFLEKGVKKKAEPATGWFTDIDIPALGAIIGSAVEFLAKEEEVKRLVDEVKEKIDGFVNAMSSIDTDKQIYSKIYDVLYKLYGLSIAEARDPEVVFGQAALSILLSATFYERVRNIHTQLKPLGNYVQAHGAIVGLRKALEDLLRIDYRAAVETTLDILDALPPSAAQRVKDLVELGIEIAQNQSLLRRDFAGRVYHEITGDIALRKGFATFYTEVPAAYLLASLAVEALLGLDVKDVHRISADEAREIIGRIRSVKVGDLACGSGTLLTASYSMLHRLATVLKYYHGLEDVDLDELAKAVIEEGIYGIDALRYASQITALNLALISPGNISRENIYTIYLGYIPQKGQAWLGSLELLNNSERVGGILAWIEGGLKGVAEKVSLEGSEGRFTVPKKFDLIIMNPPFTRPTYRGRKEVPEEGRSFFGFIADKDARERLRNAYKEKLERISEELRHIAYTARPELKDIPEEIRGLIEGRKGAISEKLEQYLQIGLAGEALPFLYLAYKYIGDGGVIAFVLPRAVLAGVNWFLARVLLSSKFHLKYVVVSYDPQNGYNFSEGASLSEALIVAKRTDRHDDGEETAFIIITRKPRTAIEGIMLAEEIKKAVEAGRVFVWVSGEGPACIIRRVKRDALLKSLDNWNRFVAIPDPELYESTVRMLSHGEISIGSTSVKIPLARLGALLKTVYVERRRGKEVVRAATKAIGIDSHQFYDLFVSAPQSPYPAFIGTEEKDRLAMKSRPNGYISFKDEGVKEKAIAAFNAFAGRVLIPGVNIWWDTSHVIVMYSDQRVLSNTHYAIRLDIREELEEYAEKALVLWFNTTWGLLTILINREETRGRWFQVKMGQWLLMPVLDVARLDSDTLKRLAGVFDKYSSRHLKRLPQQFNPENPDPVRLEIDMGFLKALDPGLDEAKVKEALLDLYRHVHNALTIWIGD